VFCERSYFTKDETLEILDAAAKYGIGGKVHAEQLSHQGGIEAGVQAGAVSVDHLEFANDNDIELLKNSNTIPTILPGAAFFLNLQLPPARKMINAGLPLAVATDYNPGSSPSGNMNLMVSMMCVQYKLTPEEAINAATLNGAAAMQVEDKVGSIAIGTRANLIITKPIESVNSIPYRFGENLIERVIVA
jgi:imidazolonepropionase